MPKDKGLSIHPDIIPKPLRRFINLNVSLLTVETFNLVQTLIG